MCLLESNIEKHHFNRATLGSVLESARTCTVMYVYCSLQQWLDGHTVCLVCTSVCINVLPSVRRATQPLLPWELLIRLVLMVPRDPSRLKSSLQPHLSKLHSCCGQLKL